MTCFKNNFNSSKNKIWFYFSNIIHHGCGNFSTFCFIGLKTTKNVYSFQYGVWSQSHLIWSELCFISMLMALLLFLQLKWQTGKFQLSSYRWCECAVLRLSSYNSEVTTRICQWIWNTKVTATELAAQNRSPLTINLSVLTHTCDTKLKSSYDGSKGMFIYLEQMHNYVLFHT